MAEISEITNELELPIRSFRLFAIEKALKSAASSELLKCLTNHKQKEEDYECLLLLDHAIDQISNELNSNYEQAILLQDLAKSFQHQTPSAQMQLLSRLKITKADALDNQEILPELILMSANKTVEAEVVKKFRRFWPERLLTYLEQNLYSDSKSLQLAVLETLLKIYPDSLNERILDLVQCNDPKIRQMAIWCMARHFPELAADFIKDCLNEGDYYNRLAALQTCSILDFSLVRSSLLSLVFKEADQKIFTMACTIILNNPDKDTAWCLAAISARSQKSKRAYLKSFMPDYLENIKNSGICEDFSSFKKSLIEYEQKIRLQSSQTEPAGTDDSAKATADATLSQSEETNKLIKEFARTRFKKDSSTADKIKLAMQDKTITSTSLRAAALKAAVNLEVNDYLAIAKDYINSEDEALVAAGLEYIAAFDNDHFYSIMQKFFRTESFLIRTTLIRIAGSQAPEYSKFLIKNLLESTIKEHKIRGLNSIVHIDFSYILPELISFLEKETDSELLQSALLLIINNPKLESVYYLRQLKNDRQDFTKEFASAESELCTILKQLQIASATDIESFYKAKLREKKAREQSVNDAAELAKAKEKIKWSSATQQAATQEKSVLISAALFLTIMMVLATSAIAYKKLNSGVKPEVSMTEAVEEQLAAGDEKEGTESSDNQQQEMATIYRPEFNPTGSGNRFSGGQLSPQSLKPEFFNPADPHEVKQRSNKIIELISIEKTLESGGKKLEEAIK